MEYRILGPLEVESNRGDLPVRSARQQIVLVMLLLEANRVVSLSRLVEAVWDDSPPTTARSQVQICVSALRKRIADAGDPDAIVTRAPGYLIRVPGAALDLKRFESHIASARVAVSQQRTEDALRDLQAALSLWRGPVATDLDSKVIQAAAVRLNENRLAVLEDSIELELELGRHHDVVGELHELVARYPLRDRLRAQHMLALYRSGRQAEALESYRVARQLLNDELGLDPSAALRSLHAAILASASELDLPADIRAASWQRQSGSPLEPRQLPPPVSNFTGRESDLAAIRRILSSAEIGNPEAQQVRVLAISGKAGVGKTAMAIQLAHELRDDYPDAQFFMHLIDCDGRPKSAMELLEYLLRSLGVMPAAIPASIEERTADYRSALARRRILLVLDNADSASQVLPLIPGNPNCAVIATCRKTLALVHGAHHFEVLALEEHAGVQLLSRLVGAERVAAEQMAAIELVQLCSGLPLALRIVAAKLAARPHWKIRQMASRLENEGRRLDELSLDGVGIRASISISYLGLPDNARRLFRRLSLLGPIDFAGWAGLPLLDLTDAADADLIEFLVESRLVEVHVGRNQSVRYRLHDLIRIFALERLALEEPAHERSAAVGRLLACWLFLAGEAHRRIYSGHFGLLHGSARRWPLPTELVDEVLENPVAWFRTEHAGLLAAIFQAGRAGLDELCWDLALTSVTMFEAENLIDEWRRTHEAAIEAVRLAGNPRGEAAMLYSLGVAAVAKRLDDPLSFLVPALRIFEDLGDIHGRALTLVILAFVDWLRGQYDDALARYRAAHAGARLVGDLVSEVTALNGIAQIHAERRDYQAAEARFNQALAICKMVKVGRVTAQTEYRLGSLYLRTGDLHRAEELFQSVLIDVRHAGDLVGEAYALCGVGIARTRRGQLAGAEADLKKALALSKDTGDPLAGGQALLALAELWLAIGSADDAMGHVLDAQGLLASVGSPLWLARALELEGRLHERAGILPAAAAAWSSALEMISDADPALTSTLQTALGRIGH